MGNSSIVKITWFPLTVHSAFILLSSYISSNIQVAHRSYAFKTPPWCPTYRGFLFLLTACFCNICSTLYFHWFLTLYLRNSIKSSAMRSMCNSYYEFYSTANHLHLLFWVSENNCSHFHLNICGNRKKNKMHTKCRIVSKYTVTLKD